MTRIHLDHIYYRYQKSAPSWRDMLQGTEPVYQQEGSSAPTPNTAPATREFILEDIDLRVQHGETLVIIGPSGCGKSTLLRVIAGLFDPVRGKVYFDDVALNSIPPKERGIGMVFQSYALFPHMDSRSNIGFFDLVRHQPEKIDERIDKVAEVMGVSIKHLLARRPPKLSGGERQRVAVARALAREVKLFLFDEPLASLDAKLRTETRTKLKRLLRHFKITAIYITHDQHEAMALADRIAVMNAGKILQVGTFNELYYHPRDRFTASFFGQPAMNLYQGRIREQRWEGDIFAVAPIELQHSGRVWLGIRPEHVQLRKEGGIEAQVELIEPLFAEKKQILHLKIKKAVCVAMVSIEHNINLGDYIRVQFPIEHLYFFDAATDQHL